MSKTKNEGSSHYEMLYIISNKFNEEEAEKITKKINKAITDHQGLISHSENWGKKRLAYPIKGFNHGYYNLVEFNLLKENVSKINYLLKNSNEILRHQIIIKSLKSDEQIAKEKKIAEKIATKKVVEQKKEEIEEEKKEKKDKEKDKVKLKDLDEKLEKILETDDLL